MMTKKRKLLTGAVVEAEDIYVHNITVHTKCPKKWLFVDLEHGHIYGHNGAYFYVINNLKDLMKGKKHGR